MEMEQDSSALVLKALKLIDDTKETVTRIALNRADFLLMVYYLVELRTLLEELSKQQDFLSANPAWPSLQRFTNVVKGVNTFTKGCASRSRIYLLCHSGDLVQEMMKSSKQLAECVASILAENSEIPPTCRDRVLETKGKLTSLTFFQEPRHAELAREITSRLKDGGGSDDDEQLQQATDLLRRIAEHMNVPASKVSELKVELQGDLKAAVLEGRQADIQELRGLCALLNPAENLDDKKKFVESPLHHSMNVFEIPKAFFCPITKQVMREPVMLEQGHTYEKVAILEWFRWGNKTCPVTGQELESLELIPNVKLQQAMDEFFSNMYKSQLIHAIQELRDEGMVIDLDMTINTVKSILDVDSKYRRLLVSLDGIHSLVSVLRPSASQTRERILCILYSIALLGDDYKVFDLLCSIIVLLIHQSNHSCADCLHKGIGLAQFGIARDNTA